MKKNGIMLLVALLVLTLFTGCEGKSLHPKAESGSQTEGEQQIQAEMQSESGNQVESEYPTETKEQLDEEEQEKQEVKAKVEKAIGESFDDDAWRYVDASESHEGYLNRGLGGYLVECYRDGDKIYVLYNPDSGMHQYDNDVCYSTDGGMNWNYTHLHGLAGTAMYFVNDTIIMADGYVYDVPYVMYGSWESKFSRLETNEFDKIAKLPAMFSNLIDIVFWNRDAENNQITIRWYPAGEQRHYLYEMTLNLDTMEKVAEDDPYDLIETGEAYAKTGYIYADSAEAYLDEIELNAKNLELISLFGNTTGIKYEIRYAINEIYARKGYDFTGTGYEDYFCSKEWYHPIAGKQVTEEELNVYEKANIDLLVKIEQIVKAADAENEN